MIKPPSLCGLAETRGNDGNLVISEYKWFELFPQQVQIMSKQKRFFSGYKSFILEKSLQASLNSCI